MTKFQRAALAAAVAVAGLANANAASSIDVLNAGTMTTAGWRATAQTFTAPAGALLDYSFNGGNAGGTFKFSIYDWTTGSAALYSTTQTWATGVNTISNINLALTAGDVYAAEVDYLGVTSSGVKFGGDVYAGGNAYWSNAGVDGVQDTYSSYPTYDTAFKADFGVSAVPESTTTAMLVAGLGLLGVAARRQRRAR